MIRGAMVVGRLSSPSSLLRLAAVAALAGSAAIAGCSSVSPFKSTVSVKPTEFKAAARPRDCKVEFLWKPPAKAYDALGELYGYWPTPVEPADVLRKQACDLGADAVIVTTDFLVSTVGTPDRKMITGTAIKYREPASAALSPGGQP
jgi:hypothetical protein